MLDPVVDHIQEYKALIMIFNFLSISLRSNPYHHTQRQDYEHSEEVDEGKPAVLCSSVPKDLAERNGHTHELDRVEDEDAEHIEEQVNKGNVETVLDGLLARASQGCKDSCSSGAYVCPKEQGIHCLNL